jgi:hypothetical protein
MCQGSLLDEESIAYSETLPRSGSMRSGVLFPRPMWEPPIFASESSFWPSTRAEDGESCGNHPNGANDSLTGVTRNWATPDSNTASYSNGHNGFQNLREQSTLWQTVRTPQGGNGRRSGDRSDEMLLEEQARMFWPTPNTPSGGPNTESTESHTGGMDLDGAVLKWPYATDGDKAPKCFARGNPSLPVGSGIFAPGPGDPRWPAILAADPWLAPALEPGFRGLAHGDAVVVDEHRTDQLRAIGNGVVALQAGVAFAVLTRRFLTCQRDRS